MKILYLRINLLKIIQFLVKYKENLIDLLGFCKGYLLACYIISSAVQKQLNEKIL